MKDLMAYLQADPARDSTPDLFKGEATLVHKGCLKCHSLKREGGRIGPDLTEKRPDYDSAVVWARKKSSSARLWARKMPISPRSMTPTLRF